MAQNRGIYLENGSCSFSFPLNQPKKGTMSPAYGVPVVPRPFRASNAHLFCSLKLGQTESGLLLVWGASESSRHGSLEVANGRPFKSGGLKAGALMPLISENWSLQIWRPEGLNT